MSLVTSVRPPWATQIFAVPKMARDLNCKVKWPRTIWENNLFLQRFRFEVSDGVLYGFAATAKSATAAQRARGGPTWLSRTAFQSSIWSRASEGWSHWCGEIAMGHSAGHRIWNPPFRVRICMCTLYDMRVYIYITIIIYWYIYIYMCMCEFGYFTSPPSTSWSRPAPTPGIPLEVGADLATSESR